MKLRIAVIVLILTAILLPPLLMRKADSVPLANDPETERLVIITPHNESVKREWETAFRQHYRNKFGKDIILDYRAPGGTSDIVRFIADRYQIEFRRWCGEKGISCQEKDFRDFSNPKSKSGLRKQFLQSDVGIGIDLMAGGGVFDMARQAERGFAVDAQIKKHYPELFKFNLIPKKFGGETIYDERGRYYGLCLSTFGLCYNTDRLKELGIAPPERWSDLANPAFFNKIVVADPTKSGSINKCFEVIIQQCMADRNSPRKGWRDGMNLIKRIIANAAQVTDSAGKVVRDVGSGAAAAGMAIDTYGLTEYEWGETQFRGIPPFRYAAPKGGTAVSPDPIQLLRGAPNPRAARELIAFLLSESGQKLFAFRPGTPGGPQKFSLRRPPVRRDLYQEKYRKFRTDPDYNPYESGADFTYRPKWTGKYYSLIRLMFRCMMLDCREELQAAWKAVIDAGGPDKVPSAMNYFNELPFDYDDADDVWKELTRADAPRVAAIKREWCEFMREKYRKAEREARKK